jgi:hypothetical protein
MPKDELEMPRSYLRNVLYVRHGTARKHQRLVNALSVAKILESFGDDCAGGNVDVRFGGGGVTIF